MGRDATQVAGLADVQPRPSAAGLSDLPHALDLVDRRIEALERDLDLAAKDGAWAQFVARLRCLRGIDTLTALGLVAEIGTDWSRFKTAEQFMSYVRRFNAVVTCTSSSLRKPLTCKQLAAEDGGASSAICATSERILSRERPAHAREATQASPTHEKTKIPQGVVTRCTLAVSHGSDRYGSGALQAV